VKDTRYVGFEADADECARLNESARRGHRYIQAFLGPDEGTHTFHVTRSAACASLLRPNAALLARFAELSSLFHVEREVTVQTTTLDASVTANQLPAPDFIELDTQGSELGILSGAERLLRATVFAVQVEVEFTPLYIDQPLFADVDSFLRARGFHLMDLSRYRGRRASAGLQIPTRGQLLWGHALYLKDFQGLEPASIPRLAVIATLLERADVAAAALEHVSTTAEKDLRRFASTAYTLLTASGGANPVTTLMTRWRGWLNGDDERSLRASVGRSTWRV
jgi:FkbM family methyltransferase